MKAKNSKNNNVLLVVDGLNVLHRGHYATPPMTNDKGLPTNAIRGMISILLADLKLVSATHCAIIFDRPGKNFRHRLYPEYKATRVKADDGIDVDAIMGITRLLLKAMGIRVFGKKGIEGDDLIGSIAVLGSKFAKVYISSNDKDFGSIVTDSIHLLKPKGIILDPTGVFEHYGVHPHQMVDYLMMLGDTVDNIPGVHRVGKVIASKLLQKHGTLRAICRDEKFTPKQGEYFQAARKHFKLTKKLITLRTDFMQHVTEPHLRLQGLQPSLKALCDELDFKSTYTAIRKTLG